MATLMIKHEQRERMNLELFSFAKKHVDDTICVEDFNPSGYFEDSEEIMKNVIYTIEDEIEKIGNYD